MKSSLRSTILMNMNSECAIKSRSRHLYEGGVTRVTPRLVVRGSALVAILDDLPGSPSGNVIEPPE
jgi:hypothetical protein